MFDNTPVLGRTESAQLATNKVLRNTYALLGLTMIPTVIGAFIGMSLNFAFVQQHPFVFAIGAMAVMFGMFAAISANRNSSMGVVLLLGLTFLMGLLLGPILQHALHLNNGAQIVGLAAGGTGIILLTLASIASTSKKDFSFMGKFLLVGIVLLIVASLANIFLQIPAMALALSAIGVILFSGFILYDVSRIVNGGETNYVMATLGLYLSIYNLFTSLLHLLMGLMGGND
ncbi:MAG: Bax inhibitor-1/YccA family protein [Methylotenera sp.]|nr:Bax inhibitor-1/YccA family protein [Methylotenera sp.]MDO9232272.1 Bax inhibitor-1/YccA family protein [Methylotenera sp.]MDO9388096.1 Bax inhibitor-1/YccA family protein [Methylotenera sp.]MDP1596373.1 Bax inhibitor-1/YccA family protein [Methylotenera sp.]MDP1754495.1 Bax inhibitor-1/YccA family protein [Methylotenera sp.]